MKRLILALVVAVSLFNVSPSAAPTSASDLPKVALVAVTDQANPPAPPPEQESPDQFQYGGQSLARYSADSKRLRETGEWRWRYAQINACSGDLRPAVEAAIAQAAVVLKIRYIEDPVNGIPMYGNCGSSALALGVPTGGACLCRGFPYDNSIDFDAATISLYPMITQVSIVFHELVGHAHAVWCEQYRYCQKPGGNFAPTALLSFMNTGPLSRHGIDANEQAMWWRTMGSPELTNLGYGNNGAWYIYACDFHENATEVAALIDRRDGRGVVFAGVVKKIPTNSRGQPGDENGCMGIGPADGLVIEVGALYFEKQQNPASWSVSFNEACVRGSVGC